MSEETPNTVPSGVLEYWILKCHRKNAELAALRIWRAKAEPLLLNYANDSVIFAVAYQEWVCTQCGGQHRLKAEVRHKDYCETLNARALLTEAVLGRDNE